MFSIFNEESYEKSIIAIFQDLGYNYYYGPEVDRDYDKPFFFNDLDNIYTINRGSDREAIKTAIQIIQEIETGSLEEKNDKFMDYLQNGVSVNYWKDGEELSDLIKLVDFENRDNNIFTVINQWTFVEYEEKRSDIVVFINGLPLVVCELKSPSREEADRAARPQRQTRRDEEFEERPVRNKRPASEYDDDNRSARRATEDRGARRQTEERPVRRSTEDRPVRQTRRSEEDDDRQVRRSSYRNSEEGGASREGARRKPRNIVSDVYDLDSEFEFLDLNDKD